MNRSRTFRQRLESLSIGGPLKGITLGRWLSLLLRRGPGGRGFREIAETTVVSARNSRLAARERARFERAFLRSRIENPLFVIGHWRSGTTYLHNMLATDTRFAYPNHYEVYQPSTFLLTEDEYKAGLAESKEVKRAQDSVTVGPDSPAEDEFALISLTPYSLYRGLIYPGQAAYYQRYLTFDGVPHRHVAHWKRALLYFLRKVSWKNAGHPLILKSPGHTARIRILLELFPDAKFVHIHRDPFDVFSSVEHAAIAVASMQHAKDAVMQRRDSIVATYRRVYDAFFAQRELIRPGHFCEISFSALERDPVGTVAKVYDDLNLPPFDVAEHALSTYLAAKAGYRRNVYPELSADITARINREWQRSFAEWGYEPR